MEPYEMELTDLGLTSNEAKIYLAFLHNPGASPTLLARETGLHRPSVYETINKLVEKGILNVRIENNEKTYAAVSPAELKGIYLARLTRFDLIIGKLSEKPRAEEFECTTTHFTGKAMAHAIGGRLKESGKPGETVYLYGYNSQAINVIIPSEIAHFSHFVKALGMEPRIFTTKDLAENVKDASYVIADEKYFQDSTIILHSETVFYLNWKEKHPLVILKNRGMANLCMNAMDILWTTLRRK